VLNVDCYSSKAKSLSLISIHWTPWMSTAIMTGYIKTLLSTGIRVTSCTESRMCQFHYRGYAECIETESWHYLWQNIIDQSETSTVQKQTYILQCCRVRHTCKRDITRLDHFWRVVTLQGTFLHVVSTLHITRTATTPRTPTHRTVGSTVCKATSHTHSTK